MLVAGCGSSSSTAISVPTKPTIVVSSTSDPTSELIAEIYAQALEKAEFRVARKKAYDTPEALYAAVNTGDVQLTATTSLALLRLLTPTGATDALPSATTVQVAAITKQLPATAKVGAASTAEDKDVIFCAKTFTDANTIVSLTQLGAASSTATLAAPDGFDTGTPFGGASLKETYQIAFKSVVPTAADKMVDAVKNGAADCGVARSSDPTLAIAEVVVIDDDKALAPNDVILPVLSAAAATIDVTSVLDATSVRLTTPRLRQLMQRLKTDKASPELVANEFTGNVGT
jgi:osmoprotectant transport system substrate-binding protein